eukprot:CAMPEP_0181316002 /NCGR_PEP_ID=MMETSP1101-20121128/15666_1 /TAXON_ID=46948 /ORGANISM="Rhodomonas abbreviata, Strain Caron Lab Isolate" /LENGTH=279 /DNA_ID=CAMNT_0023423227 /DNA_START=414 /DNA_END=1253 /DNA_ORIENTATION=-
MTKDLSMDREHSSSPETVILGSLRRASSHQWTDSMEGLHFHEQGKFKALLGPGLPEDCFLHVLRFLSVPQLAVAGRVNKQLRRLVDCDTLWKRHCNVDYGDDAEEIMDEYTSQIDQSHPAFYKQLYQSMIGFQIELRFWTGPRASEVIKVSNTKSTNIGRSRQNDICILQDEMVSRKHAQVAYKNKRYWLNDLGSINGTFINQSSSSAQKQIAKGLDVELGLHDEVEMGNSTFTVCLAPINGGPPPSDAETDKMLPRSLHLDNPTTEDGDVVMDLVDEE